MKKKLLILSLIASMSFGLIGCASIESFTKDLESNSICIFSSK